MLLLVICCDGVMEDWTRCGTDVVCILRRVVGLVFEIIYQHHNVDITVLHSGLLTIASLLLFRLCIDAGSTRVSGFAL